MLNDYLIYSSQQESPVVYHTWIAIAMVAACLERNVWLDRGFFKIIPNLYTMIMGDSAVYAKSTAVAMGIDLLYELADKPVMFEGQTTIPAMIQEIAAEKIDMVTKQFVPNSRIFLVAPELSLFLRDENQAREIVYFLTDFYTGKSRPWKKRTVTGKAADINSPCINFIGCSTAEWLATGLSQSDFGGGFMGRCLFIVPDVPPRKIANPKISQEQKDARDRFVQNLNRIRTLRGEFTLDDEASAFYEEWYNNRPTADSADRLASYHKRKAENVLKLGLIKAVMDDDDVVSVPHIQWGIDMLGSLEVSMAQAFQFIGTEENVLAELIISSMRINGGKYMKAELLTNLGPRLKNYNQFNSVINMLTEQGRIRNINQNGPGYSMIDV